MRLAINVSKEKLDVYTKTLKTTEFLPLNGEQSTADVAVIVRGNNLNDFSAAMEKAAGMCVPVVVIVGILDQEGDSYAHQAVEFGVPERGILVLRNGKVESLDGEVVAPAVRGGRGIGIRSVVDAATVSYKNKLYLEPTVWEWENAETETVFASSPSMLETDENFVDEMTSEENGRATNENSSGNLEHLETKGKNGGLNILEPFFSSSQQVIAVFKAVDEVDSSSVVSGLIGALGEEAFHLELAVKPASYKFYGHSLKDGVASGRYAFSNSSSIQGEPANCKYLIVETDMNIFDKTILDKVYNHADKVIHVVSHNFNGAEASRRNVRLWLDSGWRLDALIIDKVPEASHVVDIYDGAFEQEIGLIRGIDGADSFEKIVQELFI